MNRKTLGILAILPAFSFTACSSDETDGIAQEVEEAVLEIGGPAADALVGTLVTRLSGAMSHGGKVNAIEFCSTSAIDLTSGVAMEQGLEIKRTSLQYRNPANAPDEAETEALRHFQSKLEEGGTMPSEWVQRSSRDEYRYYRALRVAEPCLGCHGTAAEIGSEVQAILADRYPDDLATGYAAGDFRGVVRVSIPADRVDPTGD